MQTKQDGQSVLRDRQIRLITESALGRIKVHLTKPVPDYAAAHRVVTSMAKEIADITDVEYNATIAELGLPLRICNALDEQGFYRICDVCEWTAKQICEVCPTIADTGIAVLERALDRFGWKLKQEASE